MAEGRLHEKLNYEKGTLEIPPSWDGRSKEVAYMEAFARLMAGIAPWLALPDDATEEGAKRAEIRALALKAYANAVDPESPDYHGQASRPGPARASRRTTSGRSIRSRSTGNETRVGQ